MGSLSKLSVLLPKANKHHKEAQAAGKSVLEAAVAAGKACLEIKDQVKHGEFEAYIEEQADFSVGTAQRYMKLAQGYDEIMERLGPGQAANISITEGIKLLCKAPPRIEGKDARHASFGESPISDQCPKGGEHVWEIDEETGEEVCGRCHDPRGPHLEAGKPDRDPPREDEGTRSAPARGAAYRDADGEAEEQYQRTLRAQEAARVATKINKLFAETTRALDEYYALVPHDIKHKSQHNLTLSHMEFQAWRKMVEK